MKRLLLPMLVAAMVCSCTNAIEERVSALEDKVAALENRVNDNASAIERIANAAKDAVTVTSVVKNEGGYTINFSDNTSVVITDGINGVDGNDAPQVGVKEVDGVLYWTIGGELIKDGDRNIPVTGEDGMTPRFKIEDGVWKVSFDGISWENVEVTGTVAPALEIHETETEYVFVLGETVITILKSNAFAVKVEKYSVDVKPGTSVSFKYSLVGGDETTHVVAESKDFDVHVDEEKSLITVTAKPGAVSGYVLVKAIRNSDGEAKTQYISIMLDDYGTFGDIIVSNENEYLNW